jgi:ApbE superfamily uncharacterized protein (UPF0280 family)
LQNTSNPKSIEDALATAIAEASKAGRWDIVAQLARELEARRLSAADVTNLSTRNRGAK